MTTNLKTLLTSLLLLTVSIVASAQCPVSPIRELPVCDYMGDGNGNSNWNWELTDDSDPSYLSMWQASIYNTCDIQQMTSPFVNPSLGPIGAIRQDGDFTKAKGWELLRRDFGCKGQTAFPHFILYNKYTGLLRLFVYIPATATNFRGIAAEILPVNFPYPATTSFSDSIQTDPETYKTSTPSSSFGAGYMAIGELGGSTRWSMIEFNPSFDPNIKKYASDQLYRGANLQFFIHGITQNLMHAKIKGGSVTGSQIIQNFSYQRTTGGTSPSSGGFDFKGVGEKFTKFSTGFATFRDDLKTTATSISNFLRTNDTTKNDPLHKKVATFFESAAKFDFNKENSGQGIAQFGEFVKGVASFFKVANALIGIFGGSSANAVKPGPTYTTYDLVLDGTITTQVRLISFMLRVPGTYPGPGEDINNNGTYYMCPLGIFNIVETPTADVITYERLYKRQHTPFQPILSSRSYVSYKMTKNLKVAINRGAGLELVSAQAAIVGEVLPKSDGTASYDLFAPHYYHLGGSLSNQLNYDYNHMRPDLENDRLEIKYFDTQKKLHIFQTPYYNVECINGLAFNAPSTTRIYVQVKAVLKKIGDPTNTPILFLQNYQIQTEAKPLTHVPASAYMQIPTDQPLAPYVNHTELPLYKSDESTATNYTGSGLLKADNTISATATVGPAATVSFFAGGSIDLLPGFQTLPGAFFQARINNFGFSLNCGTPDITNVIFEGDCYNTTIRGFKQGEKETVTGNIEEDAPGKLNVFPTATNGMVNITGLDLKQANISVLDQTGREVYRTTKPVDGSTLQINLHPFTNGMYFIRISSPGKTITRKVLLHK